MSNPDRGPAVGPTYDDEEVEVESRRLQWVALVGTSAAAQLVSNAEVAACVCEMRRVWRWRRQSHPPRSRWGASSWSTSARRVGTREL
ncbi:MAG: hypothetical protein ACRENX_03165 [Candidatus Dormibacteria bacterium]